MIPALSERPFYQDISFLDFQLSRTIPHESRHFVIPAVIEISLLGVLWSGGNEASKSSIRRFVITEKAPTWLKAATTNSVLNVKAVVAAFNQEKAFSMITNLRMELFEALFSTGHHWWVLAMIYIRCQVTLRFNSAHFQNSQLYVKSINLEIHRRIWGGVPS